MARSNTTNKPPLVAVGMPVYNGGRFMPAAIESILGQTFGDLELIISDNASTDDTEDVCRRYAAADERVRYVRQPRNLGANPNFNAVRRLANSTYFKWASANDVCEPAFIADCVDVLQRDPGVVLCYPETRLIDDDGATLEDYDDPLDATSSDPVRRFIDVVDDLALNNAFCGLIRLAALDDVGDIKAFFGSDLSLMAALSLRGAFHRVPGRLFCRRIGPESHTSIKRKEGGADDYHYDENQLLLKLFADYFQVVGRAPIPMASKVKLVGLLARRSIWNRRPLARQAVEALSSSIPRGRR